ncbi:MAG: endonuclease III [Christensenellales bacterium]
MKENEIDELIELLDRQHPEAECELKFNSVYELLVAVILSAQCTDKRVNMVTKKLFEKVNNPYQMSQLAPEELEKDIYSCGFYHNKAKNIIACSKDIVARFDGQVPSNIDDLMSLAGVGRKTANVVYAVGFGGNAIAVDTHVLRLSNRLGLADSDNPLVVEKSLMQAVPEKNWSHLHHLLIHHGRYVCSSQKPKCDECLIKKYCKYIKEVKK